jgi:hypothetical protein
MDTDDDAAASGTGGGPKLDELDRQLKDLDNADRKELLGTIDPLGQPQSFDVKPKLAASSASRPAPTVDLGSADAILASLSPAAASSVGVHTAMLTAEGDYCASLGTHEECSHTQKDHVRNIGLPVCSWQDPAGPCIFKGAHKSVTV